MYPDRYRLPFVTAHLIALLERRRPGFSSFDEETSSALEAEARSALAEMGRTFAEIADDPSYWQRIERSVLTVALPRYLQLARSRHHLESRGFDLWRRGDVLSRATYALGGLAAAFAVWRAPFLPDWLEPLPLAVFLFGPLFPDVQIWFHNRRYHQRLRALTQEMGEEQRQLEAYRPLLDPLAPLEPQREVRAVSLKERR